MRAETRWASGRHWIVADVFGLPAGALDFGQREVAEGAVLEPSRLAGLVALTPIRIWVGVETLCPKYDCRLDDYDLSNSSSFDPTSTLGLRTARLVGTFDVWVHGYSPRLAGPRLNSKSTSY